MGHETSDVPSFGLELLVSGIAKETGSRRT